MLGKKLEPILKEIEDILLDFEVNSPEKANYSIDSVRVIIKLFTNVIMDKMWELQEKEKFSNEIRLTMAKKAGEEIKEFIKLYTGIDTFELYK